MTLIISDPSEGRHCCKCKWLIGVRHNYQSPESVDKWKCGHEKNIHTKAINVITGIETTLYNSQTLPAIREATHLCGVTGAWYEEYIPPVRTSIQQVESFGAQDLDRIAEGASVGRDRFKKKSIFKVTKEDLNNL